MILAFRPILTSKPLPVSDELRLKMLAPRKGIVRAVLDTCVLYAPSMLVRRERDPVARSASDVGYA